MGRSDRLALFCVDMMELFDFDASTTISKINGSAARGVGRHPLQPAGVHLSNLPRAGIK